MNANKLSTLRRGSVQASPRSKLEENSRNLPQVIVIVGPTASGKTDLAIKIAKWLNNRRNVIASRNLRSCDDLNIEGAEIVSADSRQIYRGMDIGTAKPVCDHANTKQIGANKSRIENKQFAKNSHTFAFYSHGIQHHLIDIKNPNQSYTVAQYKKDTIAVIKKVLRKGKLPILVGGTGLYVKAVVDNLEIPKVKPNLRLRKRLEKELKEKSLNYLYEKLIKLDPEAAYIIDRNNPRRVIRALEITLETKKPFSAQRKQGKRLFDALKIGVDIPRRKLKARIYKRVDKMIELGLINETEQLIKKYSADLSAFDAIGYRELINYLQGKILLQEAVNLIKKNTWHYAKRQITWFRKDKEIKWVKKSGEAEGLLREFLEIGS